MDMESKFGKTKVDMKDLSNIINKTGTESCVMAMEIFMKDTGEMIIIMGRVN